MTGPSEDAAKSAFPPHNHSLESASMKVLLFTREYPPYVYGGAGVHVEYLAGELAKLMHVEVRCFGDQDTVSRGCPGQGLTRSARAASNTLTSGSAALSMPFEANLETLDRAGRRRHRACAHLVCSPRRNPGERPCTAFLSCRPYTRWSPCGRGSENNSAVATTCRHGSSGTSLDLADAVVAVSEETRDDILEHFDIDPAKVTVIYNGINVDQYQPTRRDRGTGKVRRRSGNKPIVLFVGRITRQKGIVHLVNAVKYINPDAQIVLCAGAPDTKEVLAEMDRGGQAPCARKVSAT
jgi:starch synthase